MNAPLVVFGEDWGGYPSSTQHLIRRLRIDRPIVWVNSIGLRRPCLDKYDLRRAGAKLTGALLGAAPDLWRRSAAPEQITVMPFDIVAPLGLPVPRCRFTRAVNRQLIGGAVRAALRRRGLRNPILWASLPTAVDLAGSLGERGIVYYCGDDFMALPGVDHAPIGRLEAELAAKADLVLAASEVIAAKFPPKKTVLLLHGVDVDLFGSEAVPRPADLPCGVPVAGFYGTLSEWMDVELVASAAALLPTWRFVLVGPARTDLSALAALPNVILTGRRPHDELPGYVRHWDVSLLPFRDTPMTQAFNPLKLREYLAAGTPIVATPFPALEAYRDLVEIGRTPGEFVAGIRRAGAEGRRRAGERLERVSAESWEVRARQIAELLSTLQGAS